MSSFISGADLIAGRFTLSWAPNQRVVLVGGCFDVIHYGHLHFLQEAKKQGDLLVVALENDSFIETHKKRSPFHTQLQRAEVLQHLRSVDEVILLPDMKSEADYRLLVQRTHPTAIAITAGDPQKAKKSVFAQEVGARLVEIDHVKGLSTTTILTYAHLLHD